MTSSYTGKAKGRWPVHHDPDDVTRIHFRDPETRAWSTLMWEHAASMDMPLSEDALQFARKLAASEYTYPDDRLAVADLLERWNLGLGSSVTERRIALRLSREWSAKSTASNATSAPHSSSAPSVDAPCSSPMTVHGRWQRFEHGNARACASSAASIRWPCGIAETSRCRCATPRRHGGARWV